ncbi:MAG: ribokinase [Clostridiales bacterium]|nr:ribokinase [Clostridiales bacterium]
MNKNENKYILVFGGSSIDFLYKETSEGYKTEPTSINFGGKGANQAVAASRAGYNVKIITCVGNDATGKLILQNLKNNNVDINNCELINGVSNDVNDIKVSIAGENEIIRKTGAINAFTKELIDKNAEIIKNAEIVIAQYKIPQEVSEYLIDFCYKNNVKIVVTPCRPERLSVLNNNNKEIIDKITYITCNEKEAKIVFNNKSVEEIVSNYPNKVIITLGEKGAIFHDGKKIIKLPAFKIEKVVDTTGAGDTLNGNFVVSILNGKSLKESLIYAMASSSIKIQSESAQDGMPTKKETEKFLKEFTNEQYFG